MEKLRILFPLVSLTIMLLGWSLPVAGESGSQGLRQSEEGERVAVRGGSYRDIGSEELSRMLRKKDFRLINVHIPYEGELLRTDAFIPYNEVEKRLDKLPQSRDAKIVLYCMSGRMSAIAAETMVRLGYRNVWNLKEGMREWQKKGFPLLDKRQGGKSG